MVASGRAQVSSASLIAELKALVDAEAAGSDAPQWLKDAIARWYPVP